MPSPDESFLPPAAGEPTPVPDGTDGAVPAGAHQVVVIGAGPAGLTAAYQLSKVDVASTILEADDVVGGISRSPERDGWRFDIGGHRFFTKVQPVSDVWHEILPPEDFLVRPRMSRIFYAGKYFDYPLKPMNALKNLGIIEAVLCVASYGWARVRPPKDTSTFEGWTVSRFGWRLYRTFFKTYTEKVWGVPADTIQADFAAQRIKNLSLFGAVWSALLQALFPNRKSTNITSLIEEFEYPKYGPGMMWERCRDIVVERGATVVMQTRVTKVAHENGRAHTVIAEGADGARHQYPCTEVISSMPFPHLLQAMDPPAPEEVQSAAKGLAFRDFLTIALVVPEKYGFPDNWIYVHSPIVQVGRIQNFGQWSPYLVKDGRTCLGLEYFVFEGDEMWNTPDDELIELGGRELEALGLVKAEHVEKGYVVRMPKAYPMYDDTYKDNVETIRKWLDANVVNVHPVGRNGMHRYNNQDHSMYTAMLTVENILGAAHDIWAVNVEDEYHEEKVSPSSSGSAGGALGGQRGTGRDAPIIPRSAFGDDHPVNATTAS